MPGIRRFYWPTQLFLFCQIKLKVWIKLLKTVSILDLWKYSQFLYFYFSGFSISRILNKQISEFLSGLTLVIYVSFKLIKQHFNEARDSRKWGDVRGRHKFRLNISIIQSGNTLKYFLVFSIQSWMRCVLQMKLHLQNL